MLTIEDEAILEELLEMIELELDLSKEPIQLSPEQKTAIDEGLKDIEDGKSFSNEDARKMIDEWLRKKIVWSLKAIHDKIDILEYWIDRTKSKTFSIKLDILIDKALQQISQYPDSGKTTDYKDVRIKIVRHYLIFYRIVDDSIQVIRIWDSRQDPKKLKI